LFISAEKEMSGINTKRLQNEYLQLLEMKETEDIKDMSVEWIGEMKGLRVRHSAKNVRIVKYCNC
jgi:hypothetical protein